MSNNCYNKIDVSGDNMEIIEFKKAIKGKYKKFVHSWKSIPTGDPSNSRWLCYEVITAYSPAFVLNFLEHLSEQFTKLQFKITYAEEMTAYEGVAYVKNGKACNASGTMPGLHE